MVIFVFCCCRFMNHTNTSKPLCLSCSGNINLFLNMSQLIVYGNIHIQLLTIYHANSFVYPSMIVITSASDVCRPLLLKNRGSGGRWVQGSGPPPPASDWRLMRFTQIQGFWMDEGGGNGGSGDKSTVTLPGPPSYENLALPQLKKWQVPHH